jgi:hypothetical protein
MLGAIELILAVITPKRGKLSSTDRSPCAEEESGSELVVVSSVGPLCGWLAACQMVWGRIEASRMFGARDATLGDRVTGMQVGPMGGDVKPAGFGKDQGVFVGLRRRQGAAASNSTNSFSNTLSIYGPAPTFLRDSACQPSNGQHQIDSDNTCNSAAPTRSSERGKKSEIDRIAITDIERFAAQCHEN